MEITKREPLAGNLAQLLLFFSMLLDSSNAYLDYSYSITALCLLLAGGIILITGVKLDDKRSYYLVLIELFSIPVVYFTITFNPLFLLFYIPLFLGFKYGFKRVSLVLLFGIPLLFLPDKTFFGTDEIMIGYYSAYLFLHHLNPYNNTLTANVYQFYHINYAKYIFGTPYTTGGFVTNLDYPSLFFLIEIPSVVLKISPNYTILFFYLLTGLLMYFYTDNMTFLFFISIYLLNYNYLLYPLGGVDDIIWVFFVLLSFTVKDIRIKGLLYGFAISYKQDPLVVLPFYLMRLNGREDRLKFILYSALSFFLLNSYFILSSPVLFFQDILTPLNGGLLQIGYGIDLLSITNLYYLYPLFFIITPLLIIIIGILLNKVKWYGIVYFAFLFFYRVLWNYLIYWPFFSYIEPQNSINKKENNTKKGSFSREKKRDLSIIFIAIILISFLGIFFHFNYISYSNSIKIRLIKIFEGGNHIYGFLLNVTFVGKGEIKPLFRILLSSPTISANGLLWCSNSTSLRSGQSEIVYIYAPFEFLYVNVSENEIVEINAYYSDYQGFIQLRL
ncbi:hypothetical protein [Stygiolobus caldivivus]|uniref:DUF2029 domain-containing protein n=1 Tax=Stygiolobus caldivivus TaxID=2824673 RepID=A0A8D5U7K7_9CREN|nr:hypothetical protein [Stygiolobus caldivivus]BCU70254.1 hypothetical protein KN1_15510 [Stygiolobus caldivivus]